jgi:hypothetical protein
MRRAGVAGLGLLALATPLAVIGLVCWWLLVTWEMPGRSWVRRGLFGTVTVYAVTAAALTALAVLHQPCRPHLLVAVLIGLGFTARARAGSRDRVPVTSVADRWAVTFGAITFAVLYRPFVGASTGHTMALMSQTTDGATHFELVTAIARHAGYVHLLHPTNLSPGVDKYPTAWHGNVWVLADLLLGSHPSTGALVRLIGLLVIASFATLSTVAALGVLAASGVGDRTPPRAALAGVACLALSTLLGFGTFLLQLDSYTQIVALISVLAVTLVATDMSGSPLRGLVVLSACLIALMQSWYLLAPLLLVALVLIALDARPPAKHVLVAGVITAPFCLYPLLTGPTSGHVDESGPMVLPTILGVLGLLLATAAGAFYLTVREPNERSRVLVGTTVASLLLLVGLVVRQGFIPHTGVSYYGAKVLLTTFLLGSVLAAAVTVRWAFDGRSWRIAAVVCTTGLLFGTGSTAWAALPPRAAEYEGHLYPPTLDAIFSAHPHGPSRGTEVVVADGCDRVGDMVASKWLYDATLTWPPGLREALNAYADEGTGVVTALQSRLKDPSVRRLELFVHRDCDPAALTALERDPRVHVVRVS